MKKVFLYLPIICLLQLLNVIFYRTGYCNERKHTYEAWNNEYYNFPRRVTITTNDETEHIGVLSGFHRWDARKRSNQPAVALFYPDENEYRKYLSSASGHIREYDRWLWYKDVGEYWLFYEDLLAFSVRERIKNISVKGNKFGTTDFFMIDFLLRSGYKFSAAIRDGEGGGNYWYLAELRLKESQNINIYELNQISLLIFEPQNSSESNYISSWKYIAEHNKKEALGLVQYEGRWITKEEKFELDQEAKGLVKYDGRWITQANMLKLEQEKKEQKKARQQRLLKIKQKQEEEKRKRRMILIGSLIIVSVVLCTVALYFVLLKRKKNKNYQPTSE